MKKAVDSESLLVGNRNGRALVGSDSSDGHRTKLVPSEKFRARRWHGGGTDEGGRKMEGRMAEIE